MFMKLFIYLGVGAIIVILNYADVAQAKLMRMDDPPANVPQFESNKGRMRRDVDPQAADDGGIPKDAASSLMRTRRALHGQSSILRQFQRTKRQLPPPPEEMPMPPM